MDLESYTLLPPDVFWLSFINNFVFEIILKQFITEFFWVFSNYAESYNLK